jgi:hypothetical protein
MPGDHRTAARMASARVPGTWPAASFGYLIFPLKTRPPNARSFSREAEGALTDIAAIPGSALQGGHFANADLKRHSHPCERRLRSALAGAGLIRYAPAGGGPGIPEESQGLTEKSGNTSRRKAAK